MPGDALLDRNERMIVPLTGRGPPPVADPPTPAYGLNEEVMAAIGRYPPIAWARKADAKCEGLGVREAEADTLTRSLVVPS